MCGRNCCFFYIELLKVCIPDRQKCVGFYKSKKVLNHSTLTYVQHPLKLWETWCKTRLINYKTNGVFIIFLIKKRIPDFLAWGLEILGLKTCLSYNSVSFSYITKYYNYYIFYPKLYSIFFINNSCGLCGLCIKPQKSSMSLLQN